VEASQVRRRWMDLGAAGRKAQRRVTRAGAATVIRAKGIASSSPCPS